jgi:hypothetical protein
VTDTELRKDYRRRRRGDWGALLLAVLVGAFLAWVIYSVQSVHNELADANAARDQLAQQVQQLGASPVAGPPGSRGAPGPASTGPPGTQGAKGDRGEPGPASTVRGPSGAPGAPGPVSTVPGPAGPAGPAGAPGAPGQPGADSTVAGPVGPAGPPGPAGQAGKDGKDGTDGQNCPDGYSLQPALDDPDALVCRRDGAPSPSPTSPTSPPALAPDRRRS